MAKHDSSGKPTNLEDKEQEEAVVVEGEIIDEGAIGKGKGKGNAGADSVSTKNSSRFGRKLPWVIVGLMGVFIGGVFAAPWMEAGLRRIAPNWFPGEQATVVAPEEVAELNERVAANQQALAASTGRITGLENGLDAEQGSTADVNTALDAIGRRITALESAERAGPVTTDQGANAALETLAARIEALEQTMTGSGVQPVAEGANLERASDITTRIAGLEDRIDQLAASTAASGSPRLGPELALAKLMRAVDLGRAYRPEFLSLRAEIPALPTGGRLEAADALAVIEPFASTGVATMDGLSDQFAGLVSESYAASLAPDEEAGWWQGLWSGLQGIVIVRKTGDAEGTTVEAILGRAEVRMEEGDLAATVAEIKGLSGTAAASFAGWLADADSRLTAIAALERIDRALTSLPEADGSIDIESDGS